MPNEINWSRNYDRSRQEAATTKRPLLADFSAAPMWGAALGWMPRCIPDPRVVKLITDAFIPVRIHVKEDAEAWKTVGTDLGVQWTPTILITDHGGVERHRIEGFLPAEDFLAQLALGLAKALQPR